MSEMKGFILLLCFLSQMPPFQNSYRLDHMRVQRSRLFLNFAKWYLFIHKIMEDYYPPLQIL